MVASNVVASDCHAVVPGDVWTISKRIYRPDLSQCTFLLVISWPDDRCHDRHAIQTRWAIHGLQNPALSAASVDVPANVRFYGLPKLDVSCRQRVDVRYFLDGWLAAGGSGFGFLTQSEPQRDGIGQLPTGPSKTESIPRKDFDLKMA